MHVVPQKSRPRNRELAGAVDGLFRSITGTENIRKTWVNFCRTCRTILYKKGKILDIFGASFYSVEMHEKCESLE